MGIAASNFVPPEQFPMIAQVHEKESVSTITRPATTRRRTYGVLDGQHGKPVRTDPPRAQGRTGGEGEAARIACGHGMSHAEMQVLSAALHHLARSHRHCLFVVLGDHLLDLREPDARAVVRDFERRIHRDQRRAGLPTWRVTVWETQPALHANVILVAPPNYAARICAWEPFGPYLVGDEAIRPVDDFTGLTGYLTKERTPQAQFATRGALGPRVRGSHRFGDGGGDRVIPSKALRDELVTSGAIEPYKRSTSRNLKRSTHLPPALPTTAFRQADLFEELPPAPRFDSTEVARTIRAHRERHGLTQAALGAHLGIRRPHVANVERGHDRLSPARAKAALHLLAQAESFAA